MPDTTGRLKTLMASTGLFMQDVATKTGLTVSHVSRQLSGERVLTPHVAEAIVELASEKVDRAHRLAEAARILGDLAKLPSDPDRALYLTQTADLVAELSTEQLRPRTGTHQFKVPDGWESTDPASIIRDLRGEPLFGGGTVELAPDGEELTIELPPEIAGQIVEAPAEPKARLTEDEIAARVASLKVRHEARRRGETDQQ